MDQSTKRDIKAFLENTAKRIDKRIEEYVPRSLEENAQVFSLIPPTYKPNIKALDKAISEPVWEFLDRGGKRWRPAMFLLVLEALGEDSKKYFDYSIIPEVIHSGTMIVDDVEDASVLRRGKPCIHRIFGVDIAVNLSNTLFFLPMLVLFKNKDLIPMERAVKIYEIFIQEMINLSFGQAIDIAWHKDLIPHNLTEKQYIQMSIYKSGSLAKMAAKIPAVLAGAGDEVSKSLERIAESIGVSFQIQDDILDIEGEEFSKGKGGLGMDITEGKKSLMVIHSLRRAGSKDKNRLISILARHTKDKKLIAEAIGILKKYGSVDHARKVAKKMNRESLDEIDKILTPSKAKDMLITLVHYLFERNL